MNTGKVIRRLLAVLLLAATPVLAAEDDKEAAERKNAGQPFAVDEQNFDQWVFQGSANGEAGRNRLRSFLTLRVDELQRTCGLTPTQSQKLLLAGSGDIKRFLDQVEVVRKKFLKVRENQEQINQIWQEISPLQQKQAAGLFGPSSMLEKTLRNTLQPDQQQRWEALEAERRKFRYSSAIELCVLSMGTAAGLNADQHDALVALLETTDPPLVFGQYDSYYVQYALSKLPSQQLRKIVTNDQWKVVQQRIAQGRGMEQFLAQNGIIKGRVAAPQAAGGIFGMIFGPFGPAEAIAAHDVAVGVNVDVQVMEAEPAVAEAAAEDIVPSALEPENRRGRRKERK